MQLERAALGMFDSVDGLFYFGFMVGEMLVTMNKEVVMMHFSDLESLVDRALILTSVDLNVFTEILSKTVVQL